MKAWCRWERHDGVVFWHPRCMGGAIDGPDRCTCLNAPEVPRPRPARPTRVVASRVEKVHLAVHSPDEEPRVHKVERVKRLQAELHREGERRWAAYFRSVPLLGGYGADLRRIEKPEAREFVRGALWAVDTTLSVNHPDDLVAASRSWRR